MFWSLAADSVMWQILSSWWKNVIPSVSLAILVFLRGINSLFYHRHPFFFYPHANEILSLRFRKRPELARRLGQIKRL